MLACSGGASRSRTDDLYNAIVALSQLSYGPTGGIPLGIHPQRTRDGKNHRFESQYLILNMWQPGRFPAIALRCIRLEITLLP